MNIAVLVKEVPDTFGTRSLHPDTGLTQRADGEPVIDEICQRAVEAALTLAEANPDSTVHVATMGPESATSSIRKALAMGADEAIHVVDEDLAGADLTLTAEVLAAALRDGGYDLVLAGNAATDGIGGMIPAMVAEHLGWAHLTELTELTVSDGAVSGSRPAAGGTLQVSAPLPAVVSVTESFPDGRFPNFKGIMAAKKKPLTVRSLHDLEIDAQDFSHPRAILTAVAQRPPKQAGAKVTDDGTGAQQIFDYLVSNKLI